MIEARWAAGRFVCVGLDSEYEKIPRAARRDGVVETIVLFNRAIVEATARYACAFKPNIALYAAYGDYGLVALQRTIRDINIIAPGVPVVLDAKDGDIGNTNVGYVREAFEFLNADAVTVHPYLGAESLTPFLNRADKGIFVLCRTSNPGAGEFQDLQVRVGMEETDFFLDAGATEWSMGIGGWHVPLYLHVAYQVSKYWNKNGNCGLVTGATYPHELKNVRKIVGDIPLLIPGIGAQGGDVEATVKAGMDSRGLGMIINSSRGIIFASQEDDFAEAAAAEAKKTSNLIDQYRKEAVSQ
jgi:orotidine-5'-phosphate decarboxylase